MARKKGKERSAEAAEGADARLPAAKRPARRAASHAVSRYLSADERRAEGKSIRERVPRESQAGWKPGENRRDPVEILVESNEGRIPTLVPIRFGRMMQSPFRSSAAPPRSWQRTSRPRRVPA